MAPRAAVLLEHGLHLVVGDRLAELDRGRGAGDRLARPSAAGGQRPDHRRGGQGEGDRRAMHEGDVTREGLRPP